LGVADAVASRPRRSGGDDLQRGEFEPERRTFALDAFDADAPAVGFDDLLAEREAEAGAADLPALAGVDAEELVEDLFLLAAADAEAGSLIATRVQPSLVVALTRTVPGEYLAETCRVAVTRRVGVSEVCEDDPM
jgi:hypothetical protein